MSPPVVPGDIAIQTPLAGNGVAVPTRDTLAVVEEALMVKHGWVVAVRERGRSALYIAGVVSMGLAGCGGRPPPLGADGNGKCPESEVEVPLPGGQISCMSRAGREYGYCIKEAGVTTDYFQSVAKNRSNVSVGAGGLSAAYATEADTASQNSRIYAGGNPEALKRCIGAFELATGMKVAGQAGSRCNTFQDCPAEHYCVPATGACYPRRAENEHCESNIECRSGFSCGSTLVFGVCRP